jgi:acyl-CoA thioester hydrolase
MDRAAHEWFAAMGLPTAEMFGKKGIGFPLLEVHCEFHSPVPFGSELVIETRVEEVRNKVFKLRHEFRRNGELVATGYEIRAWTDFNGKRPRAVPIPEEVRVRWLRGNES